MTQSSSSCEKLNCLVKKYEEELLSTSEDLYEIADLLHEVDTKRGDEFHDLKEHHTSLLNDVTEAREMVKQTSRKQESHKFVDDLEKEKEELLLELREANKENEHLNHQISELSAPKKELMQVGQVIHEKQKGEIPTLNFIVQLLKIMSNSFLPVESDPNILEGFISQPHKNDVHPFRYDCNKISVFDRVNDMWDTLSNQRGA